MNPTGVLEDGLTVPGQLSQTLGMLNLELLRLGCQPSWRFVPILSLLQVLEDMQVSCRLHGPECLYDPQEQALGRWGWCSGCLVALGDVEELPSLTAAGEAVSMSLGEMGRLMAPLDY